ncbi:hypothetical protein PENSPDRAFT_368729 [Peniophora sp. CONT]|nr:hypothetical protein PENSPDRAFT_368729 [Peniophora sp. CONT]
MRALPIPPVRSQTLGSPMFAWVRGPNGRLMPRRIRPRTLSSRTSRNASRNADDNPTDSPPVPAVPLTGVLLSPPISTPSTLPVEPQIAQTVAEPRSPHSGIHPARSDAIGGPSTPFVESNVGLYSPSQCSERDRSDSRETLATIFPLPRSAIVALFRRPRKDEGRPLPQPPSPFPYLHPVGFHPSTRLPGGGLPSTAGSPSIPPVAATSLFHINPHSPISPHRLRSSAAHTRNLREDVTEGSLKRPRGARPRSGLLQDRQ